MSAPAEKHDVAGGLAHVGLVVVLSAANVGPLSMAARADAKEHIAWPSCRRAAASMRNDIARVMVAMLSKI